MPNLQPVHDQFAKDPRFVVVGVSVDDRASDVAATVKTMKLSWRQGFAGPDSSVVPDYGARPPATSLMAPTARSLRRIFEASAPGRRLLRL